MAATTLAELSREAQLELYTGLARDVLALYGLAAARLVPLDQKKNVTFRAEMPAPAGGTDRYLLRVCNAGEYDQREITSELQWLRALRADGLLVPEPVPTLDGSMMVVRAFAEIPESRCCALFRWVPGETLQGAINPANVERVGELLARLHRCAERFVPPEGFTRPRWDCDRLFGAGPVIPEGLGEPLINRRSREILDEAAAVIRAAAGELGEGPEVFGLIHKDLEPDNTIVHEGALHAIDFADSGWGYYVYDVAASLLPLREKKGYAEMREAFLRGYRRIRPLPPGHEELIETFSVARSLFAIRLMVMETMHLPKVGEYAQVAIPHMLGEIRRFLEKRSGEQPAGKAPRRLTTVQFLSQLRSLEIRVWAEGEKLRFAAPQGALTPELRSELAERKAEILGFLRQGHVATRSTGPTRSADLDRPVPLSFSQQRLWFIDQFRPGSVEYNIARAVRLAGTVLTDVLERALNEVVRRHAALRTTFTSVDGQPAQVIAPRLVLSLPLVDLRALPEEDRHAEAQRLATLEGHRPFDLTRGPLLRIVLLRLDEGEVIAASSMHHIIGDGWSTGLLFREMAALYEAYIRQRPSPLPELPLQYADFALWQRQYLQGEVLAEQIAYWKEQLAGAPETLDLPTDRPRSVARSARGTRHALLIPRHVAEPLKELGQTEGAATLFMVLFAAFNALLFRHSGQDDIVIGFPIANRNRTEVESLIGFFVNTLVLRTRLGGDPTFRELLGRVRQTTLGAYAHQDLPFEKLVEELRPERRVNETPLFQLNFSLQNVPHPDLQLTHFRMSLLAPISQTAQFDLSCDMQEMPEGVRASWRYRQDLFDATTVARLATHYLAFLEDAVAQPDRPISRLRLLGAAERHQVLQEWSNADPSPGSPATLDALFAAEAAKRLTAPALVWDGGALTYGELASRAGHLARRLRALGVGPEVTVGLCLERSPRALVAILAVLRAGGVYVPLDPSYPDERLAYLVADARPRVLLAETATADRLPGGVAAILLDEPAAEVGDGAEVEPGVTADNLAYVMYTSGSTGRPKGVAVTHRAVVRLVRESTFARLGPGECLLQFAPLSFDASTLEIWGALLHGGRLAFPPEGRASLETLGRTVERHGVSLLWLTAGLFHQMTDPAPELGEDGPLASLRGVRQLLAGGDVLSPAHVRRALEALPGLTLVNGYGPTENTTFTCCHAMTDPGEVSEPVPIGRPIGRTRVHLLDAGLEQVPAGVPGELWTGGDGLARGYVGRPDLTAERFVPDPFGGVPGERLYRTGDLARFRADGLLEFLGRIDRQVKIRGFRIEPGEIEEALRHHPDVVEAVVSIRQEVSGDKRLVAYVQPRSGAQPGEAELRAFLRGSLPDFMVPASLTQVESFPLDPNGKVDRRALERLELAPPQDPGEEMAAPPLDPMEELLAGIWAEVLRRDRIGRNDDFFALGGHSLLATQVVSRVRQTFRVELPLQRLFEAPTIAELAAAVREAARDESTPEAPPIAPVPRGGDLPLSFAQQRLWFLDSFEPGSATYNIPAAVRLRGRLKPAWLEAACREVVRRHEALRTRFALRAGGPVQVVEPEPRLALPRVDLAALPAVERAAEARRLAAAEAARPFDLESGPLLRTTLVSLGEEEQLALVTLHHIVSDGWSMGLFLGELATLYGVFSRGEASPLPELRVQYADFAVWQRSWLAGEVLEAELAYWRQQLAGAPSHLELPTDRPRPAVQAYRGHRFAVDLPKELTEALTALGRREGATLFMVLLAGFQALLGRLARQDDVVVGTPIAGRNRREIEGLIGFFVNTLVLRTGLDGDPGLRELLERARRVSMAGYTHQDVPFERLVEELHPERDLSFHPLFQVMLALQNPPRTSFALPGLTMEPLPSEGATAKFDLTLSLQEGESGLRGSLEYNSDLFDVATLERWMGSFRVLLEALAAAPPEQRLSALPWLTGAELHQVVAGWNTTGSNGPADLCLHELIAAQAVRTPDAVAVVHGMASLTYGDLMGRASRLASRLRSLGVGPEERVAVCLDRDLDLVVALLAVLTAGGAYVPLDPAYPTERLAFMVEDAGGRVLLTREPLRDRVPAGAATVLTFDSDTAAAAVEGLPTGAATPGNLAYVIYTSGSTGRPKGVAIEHRSAVALARWARGVFSADELDGVLAATSICFDLSIFEIFVPLAWGGRVILADNALELPRLGALAAGAEVRLVNTVPSAMAELVRQEALPASVRAVSLAGEALPGALVERLHRLGTVRRVLNLYGPSEDTTYSTFADVAPGTVEPPIGRPVAGTRAYVLDARLDPVPSGVPGELYLGGEGLARGYLGRPELTADRFVPDPFGGEPGSRLYRTGDLTRWAPAGHLEYLGRLDHQVKVRGFRIELGEIEAALGQQPGVRDAVVLVREDAPGDRRLVACVAPEEGVPLTAGELREALRRRLPDYMVPAAFLVLAALPLTPNGKLDRAALVRLSAELTQGEVAVETPRNATEELLAGIWAEVLGREQVGTHESFFEIGGHSLLAVQVISRIRQVFRVELPVQRLFASPTVAGLAEQLRAARGATAEVFERIEPIEPALRDQPLPLSFAQQRLWFLDRLRPGDPSYNVPAAVRLSGDLAPAVLERALVEVARRHEALRTTFAETPAGPVQVIAGEPRLALPLVDLSGLPDGRRTAEARSLAAAEAAWPFDLGAGPLLRAVLLRLDPIEHVALVTLHHIIADGWSIGILLRELVAFSEDATTALPPLPVQPADFAVWQRRRLSGERLEAEIDHWRHRLTGLRPLDLPLDRSRPAVQTSRGGSCALALPRELAAALASLGRRSGATPFMVLLASFQALLGRFSTQEDFAVGVPVAGRSRREIEGLIGFFVNTLVLRADLTGEPTFSELLERVRETALDAYDHAELPMERLVEALQPSRDLSQTPLFQVAFALQNTPWPELALPGLALSFLELPGRTAKFDLTLAMRETDEGITASMEYNADLFNESTILRMLGIFRNLLQEVTARPEMPISELPLWSEEERKQVLVEWNATPHLTGIDLCVHHQVAAWASATPDAPAVVQAGRTVTYGELARKAGAWGRRLRELGVGPEVPVAVFLRRSADEVAILLAVLAAGGAYLPLDPAAPRERLAGILEDAGAAVLLTESGLAAALPERVPPTLWLDREEPGETGLSLSEDDGGVGVGNLAYVIYTSGSTGRPKGVAVEHGALSRLLAWHRRAFAVGPEDRATRLAGLAFDASVWELWPYLTAGACVHLPPDDETRTAPAALQRFLLSERITTTFVPTPVAEALLDLEWPEGAPLRLLLTGGDELRRIPEHPLPFRLVNNYGPTEATVVATSGGVGCVPSAARPSIGRPIDGTRVYLVDRGLRPVLRGIPGELCLGGNLARGYIGRPDLTAERFVPDPFATAPGERLYRTGDLARWVEGGELRFLGRIDRQVKVRGVRIEPGEIEAALGAHPAVRACAVVPREDTPGERRLVAYVVGERVPAPTELRAHLAARLPEPMVPSAFVELDALPLTPNGKLDRDALPAPAASLSGDGSAAPRDLLEMRLARLWESVLGVARVGIHDDFFALGGHSLLAVTLLARIREELGRDLPLAVLFQSATVERLATLLRDGSAPAGGPLVAIRAKGTRPPLICVHPVGGNVLCYLELARQLDPDQPVFGLQHVVPDSGDLALEARAALYVEAIRKAWPEGRYRLAGWSLGGVIAYEMARQLGPEQVELLALLDPSVPGADPVAAAAGPELFARDLAALSGADAFRADLRSLGADEALMHLLERAREADLVPPDVDLPRLRELYETFQANLGALASYVPQPYPGSLVLLLPEERPDGQPAFDWSALAAHAEVRRVPGSHYTMLGRPQVCTLVEWLGLQER
jgi:amino acid adenylation domain-containing protein